MEDRMSFQAPLKRVRNCFTLNYLEYDSTIPRIMEGRVHPIQFANSVTRINVAARTHRDKCLCLFTLFCLCLAVIALYPFFDLTYYLFIALIFVPLAIVEFVVYSFLKTRTLKLLRAAVEQENEVFLNNGMKLIWHEKSKSIIVEVVRRVSLTYENPSLVHETVKEQEKRHSGEVLQPTPSSSRSSFSSLPSLSSATARRASLSQNGDDERAPLLLPRKSEIEVADVLHHPSPHLSHPSFTSSLVPASHIQIPVE